ncbi:MAG: SDR family NAD(P)-dependent oxidoreductase [Chloroflexi bacterium]|nr:SDR family NAD(P)-dependent oxidoreductase [Chloroflexota bacterium]
MPGELLTGRTALVTGASQGIGRAIALAFAREGASIVVTARSKDKLDALVNEAQTAGSKALAVPADIGIETEVNRIAETAIKQFGGVDILVNNAAIIHPRIPVSQMDPQLFRDVLNVNLTGAFLITKALLPGMISRGYGKIINISSIGGRKGAAGRSAYRITKAGMISFTESLAAEVKQHGIDVNAICPGGVDTEGYRDAFNTRGRNDNPRLMLPEEIANVAVFLASDLSSAITGAAIDSFGGSNPLFG